MATAPAPLTHSRTARQSCAAPCQRAIADIASGRTHS
jgi:hypothetical protein